MEIFRQLGELYKEGEERENPIRKIRVKTERELMRGNRELVHEI